MSLPPPAISYTIYSGTSLRQLWVIFDDFGPGRVLPANPNDRKYRARSGVSASGQSTIRDIRIRVELRSKIPRASEGHYAFYSVGIEGVVGKHGIVSERR